jgi:hypothetical protein
MQQALKSLARKAGARIVAAELLQQLDLTAAHATQASLHLRLAWETPSPLGATLESTAGDRNQMVWS